MRDMEFILINMAFKTILASESQSQGLENTMLV